MDIATVCMQHEYCNSCPIRVGCQQRVTFYDKEKFDRLLDEASAIAQFVYIGQEICYNSFCKDREYFKKVMNEKRQQELKEHPTYSDL